MIPESVVRKYNVLPLQIQDNSLVVAVHDPQTLVNMSSIPELAGEKLVPVVASESKLKAAIDRFYQGGSSTKIIESRENETNTSLPMVRARIL